jgi:hypothetical protein
VELRSNDFRILLARAIRWQVWRTRQHTRHNSITGREASPVERCVRIRDGRRPRPPGNPRSSNSLLGRAPVESEVRRQFVVRLPHLEPGAGGADPRGAGGGDRKVGDAELAAPGEVERHNQTTADGVAWTMSIAAPDSRGSESETRDTSLPTIMRGLDDRWIGAA